VTSESIPPPPSGGGGAKYAVLGVVLFLVAGGVYWATSSSAPEVPASAALPDAGVAERSTALADDTLEIPDPEPDAGPPPDAGTAAPVAPTHHAAAARSWDDCSGDLPVPEIRRVVQEFNAQIRNCYERQLKQNPVLQGTMSLSIRVAADGHVDGTQVSGSLRDRDVFACVRGVAGRMRFPAPGGRDCALVRVPFNFTPSN
jgi:hypothetical protein